MTDTDLLKQLISNTVAQNTLIQSLCAKVDDLQAEVEELSDILVGGVEVEGVEMTEDEAILILTGRDETRH